MEQVEQYVAGERDYTKIKGGTGPLVYPAAHVIIYWILYHITDKGTNILLAQRIFGVLYLGTVAIVMACYRRAKVWGIWNMKGRLANSTHRRRCISFLCLYCRKGCIAYSFCGSSTIASQFSSSGLLFTLSNAAYGLLGVWHTVGGLESRCRYCWRCLLLGSCYFWQEVFRLALNKHGLCCSCRLS